MLRPESVAGFAVYLKSRDGYVLFRDSEAELDAEGLEGLKAGGVRTVHILAADQQSLDNYFLEYLVQTLSDPNIPLDDKAQALTASASAVARDILERPARHQISRARPIMEATVGQVLALPDILYKLVINTGVNFSMQSHMVNSAIYTLALCEPMGIVDPGELEALALSGFLHDVGKTQLPDNVVHKAGRLDATEWGLMRQHPLLGYNLLIGAGDMSDEVRAAARSHHERMDGAGYPDGLPGAKIPLAARLASVVDVFNALTTETPYRKRMTSYEALVVMRDRMKGQFDPDVLKALIKALAQQQSAAKV